MATIAQLATIFTVDNSQFKAGLRDNEKSAKKSSDTVVGHAKKMATGFRGTINSVFSLRSAVVTLAGGAGIGLLVKNEMQAIDQTAKFARMIGISTEELTGLQHAAQLTSGMVDGQFNMAMQRMARRIAEAATGTGEAKAAIKELGLDAKALADAGPGEAFKQISDAIQGVEDPTQRLRIGFKLFDSEGAKLVNTLSLGREGIEELQAEAEKLGATYSDFDASQVEMANDAVERMRKSFKATTTQLAIGLAPVIGAVADQITEMQINSKGTFDTIDTGGKTALFIIKAWADGVHTLKIAYQAIEVVAVSLLSVVMNIASAFLHFVADIIDLPNKLNPLIEKFNEIPGVKIPLFGAVDRTGFMADIDAMAAASVGAITDSKDQLKAMMLEPLPSQAIDDFIEGVKQKTQEAREAAASSSMPDMSGGSLDQFTQDHERRLEEIRRFTQTELELEVERHEQRMELLRSLDESRFAFEGERRQLIEELEQRHQEKLNQIASTVQSKGQSQLKKQFDNFLSLMELAGKQSGAAQVNTFTNAFAQITASTATESKKAFKINKTAAIANALVSTYQAMAEALPNFYLAAAVGAVGFANVSAIRSQSFQGGGGGTAPSVGPTPAPPVTPIDAQGESIDGSDAQPGRTVHIEIHGNLLGGPEGMQYIADAFRDANDADMLSINVNGQRANIG